MIKKYLIALAAAFLLLQLIRPDLRDPEEEPGMDLMIRTSAPTAIADLVRAACYNCHSAEPVLPWYAHVTPVNFWIQGHIEHGREELDFSRWDIHGRTKQARRCGQLIREQEMPPANYRWMHPKARLDAAQRRQLADWFDRVTVAEP